MKLNRPNRHAFTLVELLVVIVIIAILASLITVAVTAAIGNAKRTRIKMELNQLAEAIEHYKTKYGSYPPNVATSATASNPSDELRRHVQSLFPRAAATDILTSPSDLTPAEVLWFCIRGYTSDPQRPVDFFNLTAKRDGAYTFDQGRLVATRQWQWQNGMAPNTSPRVTQAPVYVYVPQEGKGAPYVYFDCTRNYSFQALKYSGLGVGGVARPYRTTVGNTQPYANAGKFQIISAGLDGHYGDDVNRQNEKIYPDGTNYSEGDKDNLVSFTDKTLEDAKP